MNVFVFITSVFAFLFSCNINCLESVRGIDPSRQSFYQSSNEFRCLDGSSTFPYERVNDDYCDCKDGTDEPGTAACPNGSFFCMNVGYKPLSLPSSRVGDGICDCCDGSDEYNGRVSCQNDCLELGKQLREDELKRHRLVTEGHQMYLEVCQEGNNAKLEKKLRLEQLEKEKDELEVKRKELEEVKNKLEIPEKEAKERHQQLWEAEKEKRKAEKKKQAAFEAFKVLDADQDELVSVAEIQTHPEFDIDANGEVSPEEAKEYLEDQDQMNFDGFFEKVWENIRQIYRKPWEAKSEVVPTEPTQTEEETQDAPVAASEEDEERYYGDEDEDGDEEEEDDKEESKSSQEDKKEDDEEDDDEAMPAYDEETQQLINAAEAARNDYNSHDSKLQEVDREMSDAKKLLEADLGPNNEFYSLRGKCFDYTDREYVYTLCPFERATQKSKHGGMETSLGTWGSWSEEHETKYVIMKYDHGQNCWNGPDRSTKVHLQCGAVNELVSVTEPNRCEYRFIFNTPSSCSQPPEPIPEHQPHTEL